MNKVIFLARSGWSSEEFKITSMETQTRKSITRVSVERAYDSLSMDPAEHLFLALSISDDGKLEEYIEIPELESMLSRGRSSQNREARLLKE